MTRPFDCQECGACCCNTARNRRLQTHDYVEVETTDRLYKENRSLLKKLGYRSDGGRWYLNLVGEEQRCVALEGDLGEGVRCTLYPLRPTGCRKVDAGDDECLKARAFLIGGD